MKASATESSASRKRSVIVGKRRTSISLEDSFWDSLHAIVRIENITIGDFIESISRQRATPNLSSSLRVAVLEYYKQLAMNNLVVGSDTVRRGDPVGSPDTVATSWTEPSRRNPPDPGEAPAGGLSAAHETHRQGRRPLARPVPACIRSIDTPPEHPGPPLAPDFPC